MDVAMVETGIACSCIQVNTCFINLQVQHRVDVAYLLVSYFFPFQDFVNGFSCVCATGWDGDRCQSERNECTQQLCQNGATCTVRQQVLSKHCKKYYALVPAFKLADEMGTGTYNYGAIHRVLINM